MALSPCLWPNATRRLKSLVAAAACIVGLLISGAVAQEAEEQPAAEEKAPAKTASREGYLVRVPLPITGNVDMRVQSAVERILGRANRGEGARPVLIFEFSPGQNEFGRGSDFGRSLELAQFLSSRRMSSVQTVAYIPESIKGHAVLVAMACETIVMAPDAQMGDAGVDEEVIGPVIRSGYAQIADARKSIPQAIALGMLDKELEVLKVEIGGESAGTQYILADQLEELRKRETVLSHKRLEPRPGFYTGTTARQDLGFASLVVDSRESLARQLDLPASAVKEDPSLIGGWQPMRVVLSGPVSSQATDRVQRSIEDRMRAEEINFICVEITSSGGSPSDSLNLANFLADLNPDEVRTVAYIPTEARADAALIALACDQIVMHGDAVLGGPGSKELSAEESELLTRSFRENIARKKGRSWSLPAAIIDPELKVHTYRNQATGAVAYFADRELAEQADPAAWQKQGNEPVNRDAGPLTVDAGRASELGLVDDVVHSFDEFRQVYGIEQELTPVERGWADELVDALARKEVGWLLLLIGGAAIWAELQAPGLGIGGFIAFVCFLLYFWSNFLHGTATWLEIMLFLAGISCLALEIFVIPGVGVFGLGGGMMIIASLVLASQTFIVPRNSYQIEEMYHTLLGMAGAGVGIIAAAVVMRRYLPYTPVFNRMLLEPPSPEELEAQSAREHVVEFAHLLGQHGTTTTPLLPAGKARFGGQLVDVISSRGEVIERGTDVVVVEVRGNRIAVQPTIEHDEKV